MNWRELKDFCNTLDENQLTTKVILEAEDRSIVNIEASKLENDYYVNEMDGSGAFFPLAEWEGEETDPELIKIYDAGRPILCEDFLN